eukprot:TRINITY_DN33_c0_g1_i1.p1 TRINITY_DN33_c0_g1~~TRINITY_DN33_c0_g1_i1.p1  ORF type:complete len:150 (-),score=52.29 TRINITY_DN33_c0_g1_i1:184-633(-)
MSMSNDNPVHFCEDSGEFACFSNFYCVDIEIDGVVYPSTEHYFQSKKFTTESYQEEIRLANSPGEAKYLGSQRRDDYRFNDWEDVKDGIMKKCIKAKFEQHENLRDVLLATGDRHIAEHAYDNYWGDGMDGSGRNQLGIILMEIREELK